MKRHALQICLGTMAFGIGLSLSAVQAGEVAAPATHKVKAADTAAGKAAHQAQQNAAAARAKEAAKQREAAQEKRKAAKAKLKEDTARKEELAKKQEELKAKQEAAKQKATEAKAKAEEVKAAAAAKGQAAVDQRQEWQTKRIEHGIQKGFLTADEVSKLQAQQQEIATLESSLTSDGKLNRGEFQQLRDELNTASCCIWGEKHDTDGNQMAAYALGKNVFAKDALTQKMADENLSKAEAKALLGDFRRTVELKRVLATKDLSDEERAQLQAEYNTLLNKYFETR